MNHLYPHHTVPSDHPDSRAVGGNDGYTLPELIVGMVIAAIVLTMLLTITADILFRSGKANDERKVVQEVSIAQRQIRDDLSKMRNPAREAEGTRDSEELALAIQSGGTLTRTGMQPLDVRDIIEATSNSLAFRADVIPGNDLIECVRYQVTDKGEFLREVRNHQESPDDLTLPSECTGGIIMANRLVDGGIES